MSNETRTMTATEMADAIGVSPKAFRSFWRSFIRSNGGTVGADTPGSGKRYNFTNVDDAMIESVRAAYASHRRTNGAVTVDLSAMFASPDGATDDGEVSA